MRYKFICKMFEGYSNKGLVKIRGQLTMRFRKIFDLHYFLVDWDTERVLYRFEECLLKELRARGIHRPYPDEEFIRDPEPIPYNPQRRYKNPDKVSRYNRDYYYKNQEKILAARHSRELED